MSHQHTATGPLSGIRVIDAATWMAAPLGAMHLADLGADVVKVEPPGGDPSRRFGKPVSVSAMFANSNRGKRTVELDLKSAPDLARFHEMLHGTDVLISNWRDDVAQRLGIHDAALARTHPTLIRVYVTGFGTSGPLARQPAFDSVIQGRLGIPSVQGTESRPQMVSQFLVDKVTALFTSQATLAALVARQRTGIGDRIDLAMLDAGAYFNGPDVMVHRTFPDTDTGEARNAQLTANRPVRASDGWIIVSPVTGRQIRAACETLGLTKLPKQLAATTDAAEFTDRLLGAFETATSKMPVSACVERLTSAGVPVGPALTIDEHLNDPQVLHNRIYDVVADPNHGRVRHARYPALFASHGPLGLRRTIPSVEVE